jgi:hypothetical protein
MKTLKIAPTCISRPRGVLNRAVSEKQNIETSAMYLLSAFSVSQEHSSSGGPPESNRDTIGAAIHQHVCVRYCCIHRVPPIPQTSCQVEEVIDDANVLPSALIDVLG